MGKSPVNILNEISKLVPTTKSDLNYENIFQLLIAVMLSAQTTDERVNLVTPELFKLYPSYNELAVARVEDVEIIISSLGLFRTKARNLVKMANQLKDRFSGIVPDTRDELVTLAGVGRKTANVVLSEGFKIPAIAVDTHVTRVANRLELTNSENVLVIEKDLEAYYPKELWAKAHISLVHFGRYICKAQNPNCDICPFTKFCRYYRQNITK
jgi:endonuclease-3